MTPLVWLIATLGKKAGYALDEYCKDREREKWQAESLSKRDLIEQANPYLREARLQREWEQECNRRQSAELAARIQRDGRQRMYVQMGIAVIAFFIIWGVLERIL